MNATNALLDILSYRRPRGVRSESKACNRFLRPLGAQRDERGNWILRIGNAANPILWSAHTDTVHWRGGRQRVKIKGGVISVVPDGLGFRGGCLGADNGTGLWLLREMAIANVPGLYIWHYGEEHGCVGSNWIAREAPETLEGVNHAIAFDRYGTESIITHQQFERCCSDKFALALNKRIGLNMILDDGGIYTDTASYVDIVPECTNISVGYERQHSPHETQCLYFALALRAAMLKADWDTPLPVERDPARVEYASWIGYKHKRTTPGMEGLYGKDDSDTHFHSRYFTCSYCDRLTNEKREMWHGYPVCPDCMIDLECMSVDERYDGR